MDKLEDLLFTLEICEKSLPADAHPSHYERLEEIKAIRIIELKRKCCIPLL